VLEQRAEDQTPQRSARPRDKQNGDKNADAASAHEAQNKHQYKRADQTAEEYPSPDRRSEDYFAAARLLGGIRLLLWRWSGLRWTFSDHGRPPRFRNRNLVTGQRPTTLRVPGSGKP
jgi:hypothetical protein